MTTHWTQGSSEVGIPWQLAATPNERLSKGISASYVGDLAATRYAYWRELGWVKAHPERAPARFQALGLGEGQFMALFGEELHALAERLGPTPAWARVVSSVLAEPTPSEHRADIFSLIGPFIERARRELSSRLAQLSTGTHVPGELASLAVAVDVPPAGRLAEAVHKTMLLEVEVARLRGQLRAKTPEGRMTEFAHILDAPAVRAQLWAEYPVLVRYVVDVLDQWVRRSVEVAQRLIADWELLIESGLLPNAPGRLIELSAGYGDVHRDGQSVAIAIFEHAKLVYKPRSLAAETAVNGLLDWFNRRAPACDLRGLRLLDRGPYGWTEFLAHTPCADKDALPAFYWRAGALLALLHVLWGIDFHRENLIAHGDYPVVIDCEALCHIPIPDSSGVSRHRQSDPVESFLASSVLRIGLLPVSSVHHVSALTGPSGQNLPSGLSPAMFVRDIVQGFQEAYRELIAGRDELLAPGGWLASLRGTELRLLLRPSMHYERVLVDSLHPDFLRDAMDRAICLDRLFSHGHLPGMARVIEDEIRQLESGNIPLFTFRPESRDLVLSRGDTVPDFLPETPLACVHRRLRELGDDDRERQSHAIELSLACFDPEHTPRAKRASLRPSTMVTADELYAAASAIGATLMARRLDGEGQVGWLGAKNPAEGSWMPGALGLDVYDGLAGVGLFLALLGVRTANSPALQIAQRIGDQVAVGLCATAPAKHDPPIGAFQGAGGAIYFLGHLTRATGDGRWLACLQDGVTSLGRRCLRDPYLDVIAGSAGALMALLSVRDLVDVGTAAECAASRLLATQIAEGAQAGGWPVPSAPQALAGMGHGASGIALALSRWNTIAHDARVSRAISAALAFEARRFDTSAAGWCHGAPGVALAHLGMGTRVSRAIRATSLDVGNDGLCHGDLGNLEVLRRASLEPFEVSRRYRAALDRSARDGWRTADPLGVASPGLMLGLSGIGLALLGAAEWTASGRARPIPSVLLVENLLIES